MTRQGPRERRTPMRRRFGSDWMDDAVCRPDVAWTGDTMPDADVLRRLAAVCARCPVIAECAAYALEARCETGMYAGVWLPTSGAYTYLSRPCNKGWIAARDELRALALVAT